MRRLPPILLLLLIACSSTPPPAVYAPRAVKVRTEEAPVGAGVRVLAPSGDVREGAIAISPADPDVVVSAGIRHFGDAENMEVLIYRSLDGGRTWDTGRALPRQLTSGRTVTGHFDPVLAADRSGTFYATVIGLAPEKDWTVVVYRSTDRGATWHGVDASKTHAFVDKPWLAIDQSGGRYDGSLYLIWSALSGGFRNYVASSRDGGLTWSAPVAFRTQGSPMIGVGASGTVHVTHIGTSLQAYELLRSTDGGATFEAARNIAPFRQPSGQLVAMGPTLMHQFAADVSSGASRGHLYVVYPADLDGRDAPASVWFTRSTNDGLSWSEPVRLSTATAHAALPSVTVDPLSGDVVLAWLDCRDEPSSFRAKLFVTRSTDGGATLEAAAPLTSSFVTGTGIGDYNQIAAHGPRRLAMFSDGGSHLSVATISQSEVPAPVKRRRSAGQ
ncbi:MAG TPA: sialidase family protein [Thermoanaerobaculia bacterium]